MDDPFIDDDEVPDFAMEDLHDSPRSKHENDSKGEKEVSPPKPENYYVHYGFLELKGRQRELPETIELPEASQKPRREKRDKKISQDKRSIQDLKVTEKSRNLSSDVMPSEKRKKNFKKSPLVAASPDNETSSPAVGSLDSHIKQKKTEKKTNGTVPKGKLERGIILKGKPKDSDGSSPTDSALDSPSLEESDPHKVELDLTTFEYKEHIKSIGGKVDMKELKTLQFINKLIKLAIVIPALNANPAKIASILSINPQGYEVFRKRLYDQILPVCITNEKMKYDEIVQSLKGAILVQYNEANQILNTPPVLDTQSEFSSQLGTINSDVKKLKFGKNIKELIYTAIECFVFLNAMTDFHQRVKVKSSVLRMQAYSEISKLWEDDNIAGLSPSPGDMATYYNSTKRKSLKELQKKKADVQATEIGSKSVLLTPTVKSHKERRKLVELPLQIQKRNTEKKRKETQKIVGTEVTATISSAVSSGPSSTIQLPILTPGTTQSTIPPLPSLSHASVVQPLNSMQSPFSLAFHAYNMTPPSTVPHFSSFNEGWGIIQPNSQEATVVTTEELNNETLVFSSTTDITF